MQFDYCLNVDGMEIADLECTMAQLLLTADVKLGRTTSSQP